jgi:glycosyltransferase involved in cell wall biosynthesis
MNDKPEVSVVIPTFNRANELRNSIKSVLSQTFSDFELIIVDDASSDNTEEIITHFHDHRLRYIKLSNNVGGAEARNVGIREARGDYVAFQDSDDEWTCSKLEISIRELESKPECGAVFSDFTQIWETGSRTMPMWRSPFEQEHFYDSLLWNNVVDTPTLVVRKSILESLDGFDASMPRYQDWELALRLAKVTRFTYITEPLILSYVTAGSITYNKQAHRIALEIIYKKHEKHIGEDRILKALWLQRLGDARMLDGIVDGRRMLVQSLLHHPFNVRYLVKAILALPGNKRLYGYGKGLFRKETVLYK